MINFIVYFYKKSLLRFPFLGFLFFSACTSPKTGDNNFLLCMLLTASAVEDYPGYSNVGGLSFKEGILYANVIKKNSDFSYYSSPSNSGELYESIDRGLNWKKSTKSLSEIRPTITTKAPPTGLGESSVLIAFSNPNIGWAITSSYLRPSENLYYLKKSTDGGATWKILKKYDFFQPAPLKIQALENGNAWIMISNSKLEYTIDSGNTWNSITLDIQMDINDILFYDSFYGYLINKKKDLLYITENSGASIARNKSIEPSLGGLVFESKEISYYSAGENLYISQDSGLNWQMRASNIANYTYKDRKFKNSLCQF